MPESLTVSPWTWRRALSFVSGLGMTVFSVLTIRHFFAANYPESIWTGSFCDINAFFNCDSSAFSPISQVFGVPIGYFGLVVGALVTLGAVFPSDGFERTNKTVALVNLLGVVSLFLFSIVYHRSLCLLCSGFYFFSIASFWLFWRYGIDRGETRFVARHLRPSLKIAATVAVMTVIGAYGMAVFHAARRDAQSGGVAARIVRQYYSLGEVKNPSVISPLWTVTATERFEDAPIRVVEYADLLCPDCKFLADQMGRLEEEFKGRLNVAFQFFPLEAKCNQVVEKDLHPGACDVSYLAAYDSAKFKAIHDEVFANLRAARDPAWRRQLAQKYGVQAALTDQRTRDLVAQLIQTGAEYEKTSDKYSHGIRSTPTMIINNRMIIGTLPYEQLRAIFEALLDESQGGRGFIENWVPPAQRSRPTGR
jgi:protein-disulfide isomerase/uncharacterized membrane protein